MFYMRDVLGFDAGEAILWANIFIFATYLGLLGPWLSDHYGRAKVLRLSAMGSIACYAGLSAMMLIGAPEIALLVLWMPTLMVTDWLIFTFITTWAEVSDPRLGPTHMALYQTTQAVAATFIWFGLGVFLIYATGGAYWLIFLLACLGPMIGLSQFNKLKLGDEYGEDTLDIREEISKVQTKLAGMPWGVEPVDKSSRRRLAIGTAMAGLILSVALFTGPFVLLKWESEESEENWNLKAWNETVITYEEPFTLGTGGTANALINVPTTQGGILFGSFRVDMDDAQCNGIPGGAHWTTSFSMEDRGNFSDGSNETSFVASDWEGEMSIDLDTEAINLTNYSSEENLRIALDDISREIWWGHGRGSWQLTVTFDSTDCAGGLLATHQVTYTLNVTVQHLILPSTNPNDGMVDVSTSTTITKHDYGEAVGVLLGFPVLIATPFLAWIGGRDPETMLD